MKQETFPLLFALILTGSGSNSSAETYVLSSPISSDSQFHFKVFSPRHTI
uniref:Uncharacterized protein n=1 Tax=Arundo donax TaxID=35708 RepID=A0A0A9GB30_ARUDO